MLNKIKTKIIIILVIASILQLPIQVLAQELSKPSIVDFNNINIVLNNHPAPIENIIYEGRTYLQLRAMCTLLDKDIIWDGNTATAYINDKVANINNSEELLKPAEIIRSSVEVNVDLNTIKIVINGQHADVDNLLIDGRTYLQLRAMCNLLNKDITWDGATSTAYIKDKDLTSSIHETPIDISDEIIKTLDGIKNITPLGTPGAIIPLDESWITIVDGDQNSSFPSTYAAVRTYGKGKVLALAHEGILNGDNVNVLDNMKFISSCINWLNKNGKGGKRITFSQGHREWLSLRNIGPLEQELKKQDYSFSVLQGSLNQQLLDYEDVLIIGNAWGSFSSTEIESIRSFVNNGGGLIVIGVGWSYRDYNPQNTLKDYAMNKLGETFNIFWDGSTIYDADNQYNNAPVFHTFYPGLKTKTIGEAFEYIRNISTMYPIDLMNQLENDLELYTNYYYSQMALTLAVHSSKTDKEQKQKVYEFCKSMAVEFPQYYSKESTFNNKLYPKFIWLREKFIRSFIDSSELTESIKDEIATVCRFKGTYLDIWKQFNIYIADNNSLDEAQRKQIYNILELVPRNLHNLRVISVKDSLGQQQSNIDFTGCDSTVNIFGIKIGEAVENSFAAEVQPKSSDIFSLVVFHEINHIVDSFIVNKSKRLLERKNKLIANAGELPGNYLRRFESNFFVNNPQEFLASVSNAWISDSMRTLELGIKCFEDGSKQPINQALYIADVYSMGGDSTCFYTLDDKGNITKSIVSITRDNNGYIDSITFNSKKYSFTIDNDGNVIDYKVEDGGKTVVSK